MFITYTAHKKSILLAYQLYRTKSEYSDAEYAVRELVYSVSNRKGRHHQHMPRFDRVRWVSIRFRGLLSLKVMQHYQCIVVGGTQKTLTVAFTKRQNTSILAGLKKLTGKDIFPVLIRPQRMRLLLARATIWQPENRRMFGQYYVPGPAIHALLHFYAARHP